ncbi:flagellar assembly protein FliH [Burkholderia ubonensis]|uniref:flagellar assembly protein FliH n=1 Tax=Burkholderia ubonensis TaxID=101571 RepID=UPI00075907DD|nr:flagellar assembly protein FliH [Burkholderia ubonensis]AOK60441.1 flagellar assembly protein FliH [Burkholderia ubonensis]KVS36715.1 flagellar assembly protein FliH [Burkholderia ubonensis]KVS47564.1 flagellar assembly protein FliH [Burkholderia ubonensis]KVS70875.1 flagellar assembly protein FliH [Burkholderia ubonensis]KVS83107.1 flagellar assembly protein FliH [Burkholderia ubonensis]
MSDPASDRAANLTAYQRWEMASFDPPPPPPPPDTAAAAAAALAEELQRVRDAAHAEGLSSGHVEGQALGYQAGYEQGHQQGFEAGQAEVREQAAQLAALAASFREALAAAEHDLAADVAQLALDIAQQVVRQHVKHDPAALVAAVRDVLAAEPALSGAPHLTVHPADLPVVEAYLQEELDALGWSVRTDATIERGGCRAHAATGEVDATLPTRWQRVAAAIGKVSAW